VPTIGRTFALRGATTGIPHEVAPPLRQGPRPGGHVLGDACVPAGEEWEQALADLGGVEGFADVGLGADGDGAQDEGFALFGGDHGDGDADGEAFGEAALEEVEAVHDGHVDVGEDEVEGLTGVAGAEDFEGFTAFSGEEDLGQIHSGEAQLALDHLPHNDRVVDDENSQFSSVRAVLVV
jgi:hypothetical protein